MGWAHHQATAGSDATTSRLVGHLTRARRRVQVQRPGHPLVLVTSKLDLDEDGEDRLAVEKEHDQVCAVLGGNHLRELGRLDASLGIGGQCNAESVSEKLGGERGAVAEQEQQSFMLHRRHGPSLSREGPEQTRAPVLLHSLNLDEATEAQLQDAPTHGVEIIRPVADAPSLTIFGLSTGAMAVAPRRAFSTHPPLGTGASIRWLTRTNTSHEHGLALNPSVAFFAARARRLHAARRLEHATDGQLVRQPHARSAFGTPGLFAGGDARRSLVVAREAPIAGRAASGVLHLAGAAAEEVVAEQPRLAGFPRAPRESLAAFALPEPAREHTSLNPRPRRIRGEHAADVAFRAMMIRRAVAPQAPHLPRLVVPDAGRAGRAVQADFTAERWWWRAVLAGAKGGADGFPRWGATRQPSRWCFPRPALRWRAPVRGRRPGIALSLLGDRLLRRGAPEPPAGEQTHDEQGHPSSSCDGTGQGPSIHQEQERAGGKAECIDQSHRRILLGRSA